MVDVPAVVPEGVVRRAGSTRDAADHRAADHRAANHRAATPAARATALLACVLAAASMASPASAATPSGPGPAPSRTSAAGADGSAAASSAAAGSAAASSAAAGSAADSPAATALGYAHAMLGKPYVYGGEDPSGGFDCSGLIASAYAYAGVDLPRTASAQFLALPHLPLADAEPGDLVFWATDPDDPATVYHVALFLGADMVVSAPSTGAVVQVKPIGRRNLMPVVARPATGARTVLPIPVGSSGWQVTDLQHRLRNNGIQVAVTGVFDPATRSAVSAVRNQAGIPDDDYVGERTWSWLVTHGNRTSVS